MKTPPRVTLQVPAWQAELMRVGLVTDVIWPPKRRPPRHGGRIHITAGGRARVAVFPEPVTVRVHLLTLDIGADGFSVERVEVDGVREHPDFLATHTGYLYCQRRISPKWSADGQGRWVTGAALLAAEQRMRHLRTRTGGRIHTYWLAWAAPDMPDTATYTARYGPAVNAYWFRAAAERAGLPSGSTGGEVPPDLPEDLRQALGA